jgi:hypothetical protein
VNPIRFDYGVLVLTPGAVRVFAADGVLPSDLLLRHVRGDWGDLGDDDKNANEAALKTGARLLSAYTVGGETLWVITEAAGDDGRRPATTFLLPEEY